MRTALIGLGRMGWKVHLPEILRHEECELCAAVDTNAERLAELKENHGVTGYSDYREMLEKEKPELVVIVTPTVFHEEQAIAALKAGADVILDKPMATSYEETLNIQKAVEETGKKLVVYQSARYNVRAFAARSILSRGILGPVYQIKCSEYDYVRRNDWQAFKDLGGGMLFNYGPHQLDLALHLAGDRAKRYFCSVQTVATLGDAEDVVRLMIETENGMILDVDVNTASAHNTSKIVLWGKYGTAQLAKNAEGQQCFHVKYYDPQELGSQEASKSLEMKNRQYPREQINWKEEWIPLSSVEKRNFYTDCLKYFAGEGESPVPVHETVEVMRILDECKQYRD